MGSAKAAAKESAGIESPGFNWKPDQMDFHAHIGYSLLQTVVEAIDHHIGLMQELTSPADRFVTLLRQASHRLGRVMREGGQDVEEDALRAALPKLEEAAELRGHPETVDQFAATLGDGTVGGPINTHLHTASYVLDWALTGCRARLAEMEREGAA